jgi:deoxyadenosine/deoxycytidine kinase
MAEEYAFASQMFYLQARFVTNVAIKKWDGGIALEDRSIYGDMTFAENLYNMGRLSSDSFKEYMRIKEAIWNKYGLKGPDGIILLSVSLDTSLKRLRERGTGEKIDEKYWESLLYLYESKFKEIKKTIPVIEIDANIDFWQDESYMYNIAKEVNSLVKKILRKKNLLY